MIVFFFQGKGTKVKGEVDLGREKLCPAGEEKTFVPCSAEPGLYRISYLKKS